MDKEYLANKHRGGESSKKGNLYEAYYAVYMMLLLKSSMDDDATIQSQAQDAYVDDLIVKTKSMTCFHQLKNVAKLYWGAIDAKGSLAYDFYHQMQICLKEKLNFMLKLIVSSSNVQLVNCMPAEIKAYSSVEYFPAYEDLNRYVYDTDFYSKTRTAYGRDGMSHYELSIMATFLMGMWCGGLCEGKNIGDVFMELEARISGSVKLDVELLDKLKSHLSQLGLETSMNHSTLVWNAFGFGGEIELSNDKIQQLLSCSDVEEIINMLF